MGRRLEGMREQRLAERLVAWLRSCNATVYQEVQFGRAGPIADVVAERAGIYEVVETKTSATFQVLAQARGWLGLAHHVSVAVPAAREDPGRHLFFETARGLGIGVIVVNDWGGCEEACRHDLPRLYRFDRPPAIARHLHEAQKTFAPAGNAGGSRWTPFQQTIRNLQGFLRERPGATMKEAVDAIQHHYSGDISARSALSKWIRDGVIRGIRMERAGRRLQLYATEEEAAVRWMK